MASDVTVALVEDNVLLRGELCRMVKEADGMSLAGAFESAEVALPELARTRPDVVLMDIQLPGIDGIEAVRRLRTSSPQTQAVMLTVFEHSDWIFDALRAGACGYVLKRAPRAEIVSAILTAHDGGAPMSATVARKVVQFFSQRPSGQDALATLSDREHTVLQKLSEGLSYEEIGVVLSISVNTVRKHIRAIYQKLEVNSRTEAVARLLGSR